MYSMDNVQEVKRIVKMNCKVTTRKIAEHNSINRETVRLILHKELGMRKFYTKVVSEVPPPDQKQMQVKWLEDWLAAHFYTKVVPEVLPPDQKQMQVKWLEDWLAAHGEVEFWIEL